MENIKSSISSIIRATQNLVKSKPKISDTAQNSNKKKKLYLFLAAIAAYIVYNSALIIKERIVARRQLRKARSLLNLRNSKPCPKLSLPPVSGQIYIRSLKAYELVNLLKSKNLSLESVLHTYIYRVISIARKYNLTAEEPFDQAISLLESFNPPSNLLYGVPISIKDEIHQAGCSSATGLVWLSENKQSSDSVLISLLKKQGAIPFVRSNALQAMTWYETENHIYGRALNPWDTQRTTGGSSGGDAGLVAIQASAIGICSDLGGSIRIPASFCGVYGFKFSSRRSTYLESVCTHPTGHHCLGLLLRNSYGAVTNCVEDLKLVLETWSDPEMRNHDETVVPLKFNLEEFESERKLNIGYFDFNSVFECSGVVKKVVEESVDYLREIGHNVVKFDTEFMKEAPRLFTQGVCAVSGKFMMEQLQGEDPIWMYMLYYYQSKTWMANYFYKIYMKVRGFGMISKYLDYIHPINLEKFCELSTEITKFKYCLNKYWSSLELDAVVCPIWPLVAPFHETTVQLAPAFSYSFIWNLVDYPAGVLPVRLVKPGEDKYENFSKDSTIKLARKTMKGSTGLPVSIQVVSKPFEDEKALRVMKVLQDKFNFNEKPKIG